MPSFHSSCILGLLIFVAIYNVIHYNFIMDKVNNVRLPVDKIVP